MYGHIKLLSKWKEQLIQRSPNPITLVSMRHFKSKATPINDTDYSCIINIAYRFIGGGKDGAMGLQPNLILRVLHRVFIFYHRNIFFCQLAPPNLTTFLHLCIGSHHTTTHQTNTHTQTNTQSNVPHRINFKKSRGSQLKGSVPLV